jgi:Fe-S cluster assembly protein SufD
MMMQHLEEAPALAERSNFEQGVQDALAQASVDALMSLREASYARFQTLGMPKPRREEAWKYVDVQGLSRRSWLNRLPKSKDLNVEWIYPDACRLLMHNGVMQNLGTCHRIQPIATAVIDAPERLAILTHEVPERDDALRCLNQALAPEPYSLHVEAGKHMGRPLEWVIHHDKACEAFPALYIHLEANASADVLVRIKGEKLTEGSCYLQGLLHIVQEKGSRLNLTVLSNIPYAGYTFFNTHATLAEDAKLNLFSTALDAEHFRHRLDVTLAGERADASLNGLSILAGRSKTHMHIRLTHAVPNCTSSQVFKAAVGGSATHEFDGTIFVLKDAQQTDAQQLSKNLLLSKKAKALARPWLQIDADDVKCSHGATVGQLDEAQLFYLKSRGISEERAKALLTQGFCDSMLSDTYLDAHVKRYFMKRVHCALVAATV